MTAAAESRRARQSRAPIRLLGFAALLALAAWPLPAGALGKVEAGGASLEATANIRLLAAFLHYPASSPFAQDDGLVAGVGRLILKGSLSAAFDYELHAFVDLTRSPGAGLGGTFATTGSFVTPYRAKDLTWSFWEDGAVRGQLGLDRLTVRAHAGPVDVALGRFPVNDAVARIFTPNDFFAPFAATAINKAYKPGVDAARVGVSLGRLSTLELTGVLGHDATGAPTWGRSALLARAGTVLAGFDVALTGGKLAERWVAGGTFQGDLGPIGLRGEGHLGFADADGDGRLDPRPAGGGPGPAPLHGRFALGAGWRSTWRNLSIDAEYAFLSDGASAPDYLTRAARLLPDDLPLLGQHYAGLALSLELLPILRAGVVGMVNASDGSGALVTSLAYDIADEAAFAAGLLVPWGAPPNRTPPSTTVTLGSELGAYPISAFLETRFHF